MRRHERRARQPARVSPNAAVQSGAPTQRNVRAHRRALRRHRTGAVNARAARAGRFGAPYAGAARSRAGRRARRYHYAPRRAWRRGLRAAFIPWYGPVFWPYAYSDIFDFAFWPYGYEDGYWAFIYDDFIDTLFWGAAGPPDDYVDYEVAPPPRAREATVRALCREPGSGITAWPFRDIERKLDLTNEQKALLDEVREAASQAASTFKNSCPAAAAYPLTPPGRLRAMTARLQATLDAVKTVRPPLTRFYNSLSDEQQARFNRIGPSKLRRSAEARAALPTDAKTCATAKAGLTNLPIEQIDQAVKPSGEQEKAARRSGGCHDQGGFAVAGGLPERDAADAARPPASHADAACRHGRRGRDCEARARCVLRLALRRAEGALQPHRTGAGAVGRVSFLPLPAWRGEAKKAAHIARAGRLGSTTLRARSAPTERIAANATNF